MPPSRPHTNGTRLQRNRPGITPVQQHPIPERDGLARLDRQVAGARALLFEIVQPERIGREQPVIAHMPPRRMPRVGGVIEDRDPVHGRAARNGHGPGVVAPLGPFAPGVPVLLSPRIQNGPALGLVGPLQAHRLGEPNGESALLGIAQHQRSAHRAHGDLEVQLAHLGGRGVEHHPAFVFGNHLAVLGDPAIAGTHHRRLVFTVAHDTVLGERLMDRRARTGDLAPEIGSVGRTVRPPQRVMVRVVLLFAAHLFLRPAPGHVHPIRTQQRVQERP